jgi:hypothetical protein
MGLQPARNLLRERLESACNRRAPKVQVLQQSKEVDMHLSRRVAGPVLGVALALSVAVAPATAATRTQPESGSEICSALFLASQNLPDNSFVRAIWSSILSFFDCNNNTV